METQIERCCGLDVHQATVVACLLIVLKNGKVQKQVRTFGTTTRELVGLRAWLLSEGCTHVAIVYASHCTSFGRCETFSISKRLLDNLTPLASRGGLGPGSS
jgi:metal-dependent amidase/aminoacylase/carboxypeptidase family protein